MILFGCWMPKNFNPYACTGQIHIVSVRKQEAIEKNSVVRDFQMYAVSQNPPAADRTDNN